MESDSAAEAAHSIPTSEARGVPLRLPHAVLLCTRVLRLAALMLTDPAEPRASLTPSPTTNPKRPRSICRRQARLLHGRAPCCALATVHHSNMARR